MCFPPLIQDKNTQHRLLIVSLPWNRWSSTPMAQGCKMARMKGLTDLSLIHNHVVVAYSPRRGDPLTLVNGRINGCHVVTFLLPRCGNLSPLATYFGHRVVAPICRVAGQSMLPIFSYVEHSPHSGSHPTTLRFRLNSSPLVRFNSNFGTFLSQFLTFIYSSLLTRFRCSLFPRKGGNILYTSVM